MKKNKITIVIPTYNSSNSLPKTIESIRKQFFSDLEVIIIDGLSSDETIGVVKNNRDVITKVVSEPDQGIYDAINKGVGLASGELICVLGSDDQLCENALETIYSKWLNSKPDIIAGETIMVQNNGVETLRIDEDYGIGALLSGIPFCHNAMFATPEAYAKVGGYNLDFRICADADWVHRAIKIGCTCMQINVPIIRFGLEGLSSTNPDKIMHETYQVVVNNFPGLSYEDAKNLFQVVRGWSGDNLVNEIFSRNHDIPNLMLAFEAAINSRERRRAKVMVNSQSSVNDRVSSKSFAKVIYSKFIAKIFKKNK